GLLQQLLIESSLIGLLAGAVSLPFAWWTLHLLVVDIASAVPSYWGAIALQVTPDIRIFGYTLLISLLTGVAFGLTPALQALRVDVNSALKDSGSMLGQRLSKSRLHDLLIVVQVAACLVRSEEHTSELQSLRHLVCRLLLEKKKIICI